MTATHYESNFSTNAANHDATCQVTCGQTSNSSQPTNYFGVQLRPEILLHTRRTITSRVHESRIHSAKLIENPFELTRKSEAIRLSLGETEWPNINQILIRPSSITRYSESFTAIDENDCFFFLSLLTSLIMVPKDAENK